MEAIAKLEAQMNAIEAKFDDVPPDSDAARKLAKELKALLDTRHKLGACETFLGDPPGWLKEKMFDEPAGISIAGGKMYIADTNNHRIQIVDMTTKAVSTLRLQDVEPVRRGEGMVIKGKDAK